MNCICIRSSIALIITLLVASIPLGFVTPAYADKWALLIGIDKYRHVEDLAGAENDVNLMKNTLTRYFEFPEDNIETLINEQATEAGIISAFESHLIHNPAVNQGDVVLVYYAGHGSQVPDEDGDEPMGDGFDESLVPHDSRGEKTYDITDDQINGLMQRLIAKTDHVVFFLDSCHSGAAAREGATQREVEPDHRPQPKAPPYASSPRGRVAEGNAGIQRAGSKWILMSAAQAQEKANEDTFDGRRHGVYTWEFVSAVQKAKSGARLSYSNIHSTTKIKVNQRFPSQTPQIEGLGRDVALFGTDTIDNRRRYVSVTRVEGDVVHLDAGEAQMVGNGSIFKVYAPQTADFTAARPVANLEVTNVQPFSAVADITSGGPVEVGSKAVLEQAMYALEPISVYLSPQVTKRLPELAGKLDQRPALRVVKASNEAKLILDVSDDKLNFLAGDRTVLKQPIALSTPEEKLAETIFDTVYWIMTRNLENRAGGVDVDFTVLHDGQPLDSDTEVLHGDKLTLRVKNREHQDLYIYVLDISMGGFVGLVFPAQGGGEPLKPGVETDLFPEVWVGIDPGYTEGEDILKLIATTEQIDPSVFPPPLSATRADTFAREPVRETGHPLSDFLAWRLRGGTRLVVPDLSKKWGTAQQTVRIRRRDPSE